MDAGVVLTLLFGGLGIALGGYSVQVAHPIVALLSYVFGSGCVAAAMDLAIRRGGKVESKPPPAVMSSESVERATVAVAVGPSLPMVIPPETDHRLATEISPFELLGFFEDHLSPQAEKLAEAYLGNRIPLYAKVNDVSVYSERVSVYGIIENPSETRPARTSYNVILRFDQSWRDRLIILKRGQYISLTGEISKVEARVLTLSNCELRSNV